MIGTLTSSANASSIAKTGTSANHTRRKAFATLKSYKSFSWVSFSMRWDNRNVHQKANPVFSIENLQFSSLVSSSRIIGWLAYGITFLRLLFYLQIERVTVLVPDQNIWSLQKKVQRKSHGYKSRGKAYEGNGSARMNLNERRISRQ